MRLDTLPLTPRTSALRMQRGIVLPVVLVLLVVLAFVGLFAARRSAVVEEVSNNHRVSQVAMLSAQSGLRYCEAVVMDWVDDGAQFTVDVTSRIRQLKIAGPEPANAEWDALANWADSSTMLITAPVADSTASADMADAPPPRCIAESMQSGQYLITARGLSAGATIDNTGQLIGGAEVWLQSIISPVIPVRSADGGLQ